MENICQDVQQDIKLDYIIRATAANAQIRAFAIRSTNLVEEARTRHQTSPIATAALGRLLSAGAMMGSMMKNDSDVLTLQVTGDGPIGGITVTANSKGDVKGYVNHPEVMIPPKNGKLDVGGAVGQGVLSVIKDMGLKEPFTGQVQLQTGEIGDDITYYFLTSEQVPSSVGLGVLLNHDYEVDVAGGFIIQVMPFIDEDVLDQLEANITRLSSVTQLLKEYHTAEDMLRHVLHGFDVEITDRMNARFFCDCSKERIEKALISVGKVELDDMIKDGETIEVMCHFCNTAYYVTVEELKVLRDIKD